MLAIEDSSRFDDNTLLEHIRQIRKSLSAETNPPIDQVIQSGIVPMLVRLLEFNDFPELQHEAVWSITNIASGTKENTQVVIDHGAVVVLVKLLGSPHSNVRDQATWALGNIAINSSDSRDLVLAKGALIPLLALLETAVDTAKQMAMWLVSNLCSGILEPEVRILTVTVLARIVSEWKDDKEVFMYACQALGYLSRGTDDIQDLIDSGVCQRLVELLQHPSFIVSTSALHVVGNVALGNQIEVQHIIDHGVLRCLLSMLARGPNTDVKKDICWTISNITAGSIEQKQAVIDACLIGPLVYLLKNAEFEVKKEAAWAIANLTNGGTREQILYLANQDCIPPLCDFLLFNDSRMIIECLSALENILEVGDARKSETGGINDIVVMIEQAEGLEKIVGLQNHLEDEIYEKCVEILEKYWLANVNVNRNGWWKCEIAEQFAPRSV